MPVADICRERRIAWLLTHTTLREFEAPLLRSLGYEVYTGKQFLVSRDNRSMSASYADDQLCTLPQKALDCLNSHNFNEHRMTPAVAQILNEHFGTVCCSPYPGMIDEIAARFAGRVVVRAFGREHPNNYSQYFHDEGGPGLWRRIREIEGRFWFAACYESIAEIEEPLLQRRAVTLPLGLPDRILKHRGTWQGGDPRLLFFCPSIAEPPSYYGVIYKEFKRHFGAIPHLIAGHQNQQVDDPNVAGFVPSETLATWLRTFDVMYYHSREPRHLHYHPLEAIVHGMPVIFMRGGLMEAFGGRDQPGACDTYREARQKIRRILDGDRDFIATIQARQQAILKPFTWDFNKKEWQRVFVEGIMRTPTEPVRAAVSEPKRLAIFLPQPYRGGTLRATKDLAKMIHWQSRQRDEPVDVVLSVLQGYYDFETDFHDLKALGIAVRPTEWKAVGQEGRLAARHCKQTTSQNLRPELYVLPTDRANDWLDCDFWLIVSDRVNLPLLPVRPYGALVFDYLQRYVPEIFSAQRFVDQANGMIPLVRNAEFVMVTTSSTLGDLNAYAGVPRRNIHLVPLYFDLLPEGDQPRLWPQDYLLWVTNPSPHKNHLRVTKALQKYYDEFNGKLSTVIVGPDTDIFSVRPRMVRAETAEVTQTKALMRQSASLRKNLRIEGELSETAYASAVKHARYLLHGNLNDNGTFSVIDGASFGVASLSARYPAMEHLNETCQLNLTFFDPHCVNDLAKKLKAMETEHAAVKLPDRCHLQKFHWKNSGVAVCDVVMNHLKAGVADAYR